MHTYTPIFLYTYVHTPVYSCMHVYPCHMFLMHIPIHIYTICVYHACSFLYTCACAHLYIHSQAHISLNKYLVFWYVYIWAHVHWWTFDWPSWGISLETQSLWEWKRLPEDQKLFNPSSCAAMYPWTPTCVPMCVCVSIYGHLPDYLEEFLGDSKFIPVRTLPRKSESLQTKLTPAWLHHHAGCLK